MNSERIQKIKKATLTSPYIFYFIFIFLMYIIINIFVNKLYLTGNFLFTSNPKIVVPYIFFTILVALLVAVNINLVILKFRELRKLRINRKEGGLTLLGMFGGLLGSACPGCFAGLFPAILGLFGITASLSILPLYGIEIQIASSIILIISITLLTKDYSCKVKI